MLYPQGYGSRFGPELLARINDPETVRIDVATAWVRASGMRHLRGALAGFLGRGGHLNAVVGIDRDNTSAEGLRALTALAEHGEPGTVMLWVRHNEAGFIYHPKLYAFRSAARCDVFVGSNNLTQAGLFQNEELSALVSDAHKGPLATSLDNYFTKLTSGASKLARPLDEALVVQLVEHGYVSSEATLAGKIASREKRAKRTKPLFGVRRHAAPPVAAGEIEDDEIEPEATDVPVHWSRVFVRLKLARGTQAQLPLELVRALRAKLGLHPLDGPTPVTVRGDPQPHVISPAYATRKPDTPNTYKFEAFEPTGDALIRLELVGNQIFVEELDSAEPLGEATLNVILEGLSTDPPETLSTVRDLDRATLYRFT